MIKQLNNKKAQSIMGEYLLVFYLVIGIMTAMTIYFRRVVQARIYDARNYMVQTVLDGTATEYTWTDGEKHDLYEYEPYYFNTASNTTRSSLVVSDLGRPTDPSNTSGTFAKTFNEFTMTVTQSRTAPPREASWDGHPPGSGGSGGEPIISPPRSD